MFKYEHIVILLLIGYVVFLHLKLAKKNVLLDYITLKLFGSHRKVRHTEIMELINNPDFENQEKRFRHDPATIRKIRDFVSEDQEEASLYVHFVKGTEQADAAIDYGLRFEDSFHRSIEQVYSDRLDYILKQNETRTQGSHILIIGISKKTERRYRHILENPVLRQHSLEHIISVHIGDDEDHDDVYLLPNQFIKGYVDLQDGEIKRNSYYDPEYSADFFGENIEKLTSGRAI